MKLQVEITRQDYSDLNKFHFVHTRLKKTIIMSILILCFSQFILNYQHFDLIVTIISTILFVAAYSFGIIRSLNKTSNIPDKNGSILGTKDFEFTDDKIIYKSQNSEGSNDWSKIRNLQEGKKAFYLYMDTNMAILIPKRIFKDNTEMTEFRDLVNKKIKPVEC
jgi:hypothetical protein